MTRPRPTVAKRATTDASKPPRRTAKPRIGLPEPTPREIATRIVERLAKSLNYHYYNVLANSPRGRFALARNAIARAIAKARSGGKGRDD